jgi:hypothetical protein
MGAAARTMIEHALGHALGGADATEVEWVFRELMEAAEGHPNYSTSFEVEDVRFSLGISAKRESRRIAALALDFTVSPGQDPAATARWAEAFGRVKVVVARADLAAPRPLAGEPGHDPELRAPCGHADAIVEHERTRPTFVELLRRSLGFGGFPGWSEVDAAKRPAELLAALVDGLPAI